MALNSPDRPMTLAKAGVLASKDMRKVDPFDPARWTYLEALIWTATRDLEAVSGVRAWFDPSHYCRGRRRRYQSPTRLRASRARRRLIHRAMTFLRHLPATWLPADQEVADTLNRAARNACLLPPVELSERPTDPIATAQEWTDASPTVFAVTAALPWFASLPLVTPHEGWLTLTEAGMWVAFGHAVSAPALSAPPIAATGMLMEALRGTLEQTIRKIADFASENELVIRGRLGREPASAGDEQRFSPDDLRSFRHFDWVRVNRQTTETTDTLQKFAADFSGSFAVATSPEPACYFDVRVSARDLLRYYPLEKAIANAQRRAGGDDLENRVENWMLHAVASNPDNSRRRANFRDEAKKLFPDLNDWTFLRIWQRVSKVYPRIAKQGRKPIIKPKIKPEIDPENGW